MLVLKQLCDALKAKKIEQTKMEHCRAAPWSWSRTTSTCALERNARRSATRRAITNLDEDSEEALSGEVFNIAN